MQDNNQTEEREKLDRGEPLVSRESNASKAAVTLFFVVAVMALGYAVLKRDKPSSAEKKEETFKVAGATGKPYIAPSKPVAEEKPAIAEVPVENPRPVTVMDMEQRRLIAEKEKRLLERRLSPQLILSQSAKEGSATSVAGDAAAGTEEDANRNFASRLGSKEPKRIKSAKLGNLSALVTQGTMIPGVLETAISSDLPGNLRAKVAEDVYSFDGKSLLIPRDSMLIGTYRASASQGQYRVFVIWQRLLRPDGVAILLDSLGTDSLGRSGLAGDVDTHFMERFGSTIMLSLIDGAIQAGVNAANDRTTADVALNSGNDLSRASEIALENSINIKPTIHVDQGTRINIFVQHDMDFAEEIAQESQVHVYR
jgi:type IV secretion system protein VirB10